MSERSMQAGVTLIELLVAVLILGILLAIAIPSFSSMFEKNRLKGAAERLAAQTQYARSEAIARNSDVTIAVQTSAPWCFGVSVGSAACDCGQDDPTQADACQIDGTLRRDSAEDFTGIGIQGANVSATFNSVRGTPEPGDDGTIVLESQSGMEVGVQLTALGNVHLCSPSGSGNIWDYPECP